MRTNVFVTMLLLGGFTCSTALAAPVPPADAPAPVEKTAEDPLASMNRPVFNFNVDFDRYVFKPVIATYDVLPLTVRHHIGNFLSNLSEPLNTVHGVLQANPKIAFTSMWRFILNTTFGLGGLRDFAQEDAGLRNMDQNLGITLGRWGVDAGPYVVLPIFGPSSVRDTTGRIGDWFLDPVGWELTTPAVIGQSVADGIDTRDSKSALVEQLYYQALDPYTATRSTYRQHEAYEASRRP